MPTTEVKLDYGDEALDGVVYGWNLKEHFGVAHEAAANKLTSGFHDLDRGIHFVMRSSILRGSRIKVGRTTRLRSAPGRSWEIIWERT
jgi:hypothetical protein